MIEMFRELLLGNTIASSMFVLVLVIFLGTLLSRLKVRGVSLGVTWVLFVGILLGHFGLCVDGTILSFMKEVGMVLFIFGIGMIVGPSFFSSFRQGGLRLNFLSLLSVVLSLVVTYLIFLFSGTHVTTLMGILSGAITNTPSLAAAQEASRMVYGEVYPNIGIGYALGYPVAIIGMIVTLISIKKVFKININKENERIELEERKKRKEAMVFTLELTNPALFGKNVYEVKTLLDRHHVVISRILHEATGEIEMASSKSTIQKGDKLLVIAEEDEIPTLTAFIGEKVEMTDSAWFKLDNRLVSHRVLVTKPEMTGKSIEHLKFRSLYNVNVSRVYRAGVHLIANADLQLQVGDTLIIVGLEEDVKEVERVLGNSASSLRHPNILIISLAILLGVIAGSIELQLGGMSMPVKLGFSGGTLVISILLSAFGTKWGINTYNSTSINMMLRELGITIFLACVGLSVGETFLEKLVGGGYIWMGYAALMMMIPLWITLTIGRLWFKFDYYTLIGYIAGNMSFSPALSISQDASNNNIASIRYATVYPLTLFLRVMAAQWMILMI